MALDDVVVPALKAAITSSIVGTNATGQIRSLRYGEQLQVGQAPEGWLVNISGQFPEGQGSDREESNWQLELQLYYPFGIDQTQPEEVLATLIEPVRQIFRTHLKLGDPIHIARARALSATWLWRMINDVPYRVVNIRIAVREKIPVKIDP